MFGYTVSRKLDPVLWIPAANTLDNTTVNNFDGSLRERDHWGDPDVDGGIILRWVYRKWEGVVGTGWSGLRIGTSGGHLCEYGNELLGSISAGNFLTSCKTS
jgi:hypothetical protein